MPHLFRRMVLILVILTLPVLAFAGPGKSDKKGNALADQLQMKLAGVSPLVIVIVDPSDNSVLLSGTVASQEEADRITTTIRSIEDVRLVHSNLTIAGSSETAGSDVGTTSPGMTTPEETTTGSTGSTMSPGTDTMTDAPEGELADPTTGTTGTSDAAITAAVEERLKSEGLMGESKIRVSTENGVVTLTGTALSEAQMDRIVELARGVAGVASVKPNLALRDERRDATPQPSEEVDKEGREAGDMDSTADDPDDPDDDDDEEE